MILEAISPVHVGSGDTLTVVDILPGKNGTIHILDTEGLLERLIELGADMEEILDELRNVESGGSHYIWERYLKRYGIAPGDVSRYILPVNGSIRPKSMKIWEFIKTSGKPYVPGSSLKGPIRTAVFYEVIKDRARELDAFLNGLLEMRRVSPKWVGERLETLVFGYARRGNDRRYEPKHDPMRALVIRDGKPFGPKHLTVYEVATVGAGRIPQYVEGIEGLSVEMELRIDGELLERGLKTGTFNGLLAEEMSGKEDFENLIWRAVDSFSREIISFELRRDQLKKYDSFSGDIERFYRGLKGLNGHRLRLGWGSGWYSMTLGALFFDSHMFEYIRRKLKLGRNPVTKRLSSDFPRTRRVANRKPMGWVLLRE
ncbi:hypothetical protein APY94_04205 [Thermococcus celericrescens]|uniref:CRISPR system Cms protein Csm5 n=1 Tax=Thermococcus celericrescens TaxID=227598 RepID=A0A117ITJ0_9EURY|nr:type III-A CRISPR-associated RAMP protein Csm5 [Thermococcus celericrescens]KUH33939.1 hypothetical protein APY94_04205 [Thermococcus celericrescens]